jgi:hypothetical protein
MRRLSQDDKDDLLEILQGHGWPILLTLIEDLCSDIDKKVLSYNLTEGPERLVHEKARSEGARKLQQLITQLKGHYSKQEQES